MIEIDVEALQKENKSMKSQLSRLHNKWASISEIHACGGSRATADVLFAIDLPPEFFPEDESVGRIAKKIRDARTSESRA